MKSQSCSAPQPSEDDRERIAAILQLRHPGNMYSTCERDADAILAAGFSRASVPDAATELRAERDAALARIAEAAKLHQRFEMPNGFRWCSGCSTDEYPEDWPCDTAIALGLSEVESE